MNNNPQNLPIIIDLGSGQIKVGFSGQELPKKYLIALLENQNIKK